MGLVNYEVYPRERFDTLMPWAGMRRCILKNDGTVNYYLHPENSSYKEDGTPADLTGADGQVMVEIPKFYYKVDNNETDINWYVSSTRKQSFMVHPAFFVNRGDGIKEVDYRYISAFPGSYMYDTTLSKPAYTLVSLPGLQPSISQALSTYRTMVQLRGAGWTIWDFNLISAIQLLFLLEYGTFDSKSCIGNGFTNVDPSVNLLSTGSTLNLGNTSSVYKEDVFSSISYRGIEDLWSNVWRYIDGIIFTSNYDSRYSNSATCLYISLIPSGKYNDAGTYGTSYVKNIDPIFCSTSNCVYYISDLYGDPELGFMPSKFSTTANNFFNALGGHGTVIYYGTPTYKSMPSGLVMGGSPINANGSAENGGSFDKINSKYCSLFSMSVNVNHCGTYRGAGIAY